MLRSGSYRGKKSKSGDQICYRNGKAPKLVIEIIRFFFICSWYESCINKGMKRERTQQEMKEDRKIAALKAKVDEDSLTFVSIWDSEEEYLYLWNVMDRKSELYQSTISGKLYANERIIEK